MNEYAYSFCQLCSQLSRAWKQKHRETEKDESFRKTSWSWLGGFGRAKTLKKKKRGGMEGRTASWFGRDTEVSALNNGDSRTTAVI